jgi:hypothetical protein
VYVFRRLVGLGQLIVRGRGLEVDVVLECTGGFGSL